MILHPRQAALLIQIWRCCRDWPVIVPEVFGMGRCGYCNQIPIRTDKTPDQYMNGRKASE